MNPFQEHARNVAAYQTMLKGEDNSGGATLTFTTLTPQVTVDCRFERIDADFILSSGRSSKLRVDQCSFLASDIPEISLFKITKGLPCVLTPNPTANPVPLQLWIGGLEQGGLIFRFMLVDINWSA
jgi:hypothetical protein